MRWTVIGAGSILPREGYGCSGYALQPAPDEPVTLFDCGPGTVRALASVGIELAQVRRIVLSHFHPDHCLDVFALAFARRNPRAQPGPIQVIGPRGLTAWLAAGVEAFGHWVELEDSEVLEVEPSAEPVQVLAEEGLALAAVRTRHTETSLAWRATWDARSVTYSGDAREVPELAQLASATDLFVCECSAYDDEPMVGHLSPGAVARLASAAGVRAVVLTHFYPQVEPERARDEVLRGFGGRVEVARDGSVFEVG